MYASGRGGEIPFWAMATLPVDHLEQRSREVVRQVGGSASVVEGRSLPGAGSVPGKGIPGPVVLLTDAPAGAWEALLHGDPPVITRREPRGLIADLRTVDPTDDRHVAAELARTCRS